MFQESESQRKRHDLRPAASAHSEPSVPSAGAFSGAAEQDAGNQTGAAAGSGGQPLQRGAHVRGPHGQPEAPDGPGQQRQDQAGRGAEEHAGPGGGLQTQVTSQSLTLNSKTM